MNTDSIAEVGIDEQERIYVRPGSETFPYIYREGVEVSWEASRHYLHSPKPREWTHLQWFQHILDAADLQSCNLQLTPSTVWTNIPDDLCRDIQHAFAARKPKAPDTEQKRQERERATREYNYRSTQEPRLKAEARALFFKGRYSEVGRIEAQLRGYLSKSFTLPSIASAQIS